MGLRIRFKAWREKRKAKKGPNTRILSQAPYEQPRGILDPKPRIPVAPVPKEPEVIPEVPVFALYDFEAETEGDLPFAKGDMLMARVTDEKDWWQARNIKTGKQGEIPRNYVTQEEGISRIFDAYHQINRSQAEFKLIQPGVEPGSFIVRPCGGKYKCVTTMSIDEFAFALKNHI